MRTMVGLRTVLVVLGLLGLWGGGWAAEPESKLPEGPGLAAKYPLDEGIGKDPNVLFAENFETGDLADLAKRWANVSNKNGEVLAFSDDVAVAGKRSIQMSATLGKNTGGHLYTTLPRAVDTAFARFHVKFPKEADYIHHFVHFGGYNPATKWAQGGAGERPRGDERMTVGIEPHGGAGRLGPPGAWNFYAYWQEMKISADGKFWGNAVSPVKPLLVPRDSWQCVEIMFKCNSAPNQSDGELALWLDGKLAMHVYKGVQRAKWSGMGFKLVEQGGEPFEGLRWRKTDRLKVNFFWLLHYVTDNAAKQNKAEPPTRPVRVWFDDIVVATEYIGPVQRK